MVGGKEMEVKKISLGFPINVTQNISYEEIYKYNYNPSQDVNLKLVITCDEYQKKEINEIELIKKIKGNKKINSLKIVYDVKKNIHVRSDKITELKTLKDKFIEYAKVEEIEYDKDIINAINEVELNKEISYFRPKHAFRLLNVKLKGATGLKKNSNLDEYELNLEKYPDGLIALCGSNGCGKTTLLENCHPYPKLLTRKGTLQEHFFLKQSLRELLYINEENTYYKISMLIDGKTKSGKVKYFVATGKDKNNLKELADCDGGADAYAKWVNQTFGPVELYLRTAFFAKEVTPGVPDLSRATKGEKKELFTTLLGIDYLNDVSLFAKEKSKEVDVVIQKLQAQAKDYDFDEQIKNINISLEEIKKDIKKKENSLHDITQRLDDCAKKNKAFDLSTETEMKKKQKELKDRKESLSKIKKICDEWESKKIDYLKLIGINTEFEMAEKKYNDFIEESFTPAEKEETALLNSIKTKETEIKYEEEKLNNSEKNSVLQITEICPTCGQKISKDISDKLQNDINLNIIRIKALKESVLGKKNELKGLKEKLSRLNMDTLRKEKGRLCFEKEKLFSSMDKNKLNEAIDLKNSYEKTNELYSLEELTKQIAKIDLQLEECEKSISLLNSDEYNILQKEERKLTQEKDSLSEIVKELYKQVGSFEIQVQTLEREKNENEKLSQQLKVETKEFNKWKLINKAFGVDGIQALELEALSPEIADITNNILQSAYGERFKIAFNTIRIGTSGQTIEDFNILVEDTRDGTTEPIEWLSSGEAVWIKAALYNAFSIVRMRSTGVSMKVVFADEVDGSLDSESRLRYMRMIKTAHNECNAAQTILITHSSELKDSVDCRIDF